MSADLLDEATRLADLIEAWLPVRQEDAATVRGLVERVREAETEVERLNAWINTYAYDKAGFKL